MEPDGMFGLSDQVWPAGVLKLLGTTHSGLDKLNTSCI